MKKIISLILVLVMVLSIAVPGMAAGKAKTKITLNLKGTVPVSMNTRLQLTATVTPEATVTWKSSKPKIASVDNTGMVTTLKEGKATITAKAGGKTAKVTIKVFDPKKPTGLTITQGKKYTLDIDKTLKLGVTLKPDGAESGLKFKSSKTKVATVNANGVVSPKKEGKTKITVTSTKNKKAKATITVTVKDPYKPTKLTIDQGKSVSLVEGKSLALTTKLTPSTAKSNLAFKSSKNSVATVDANGKVTAHKKGTAKITVTAGNNKKSKATITVKVISRASAMDLTRFIGKKAPAAMQELGLSLENTYEYNVEGKYVYQLKNNLGIEMRAYGKDLASAEIFYIQIVNGCEYTLFGVRCGIDEKLYHSSINKKLLNSVKGEKAWGYNGSLYHTIDSIFLEKYYRIRIPFGYDDLW